MEAPRKTTTSHHARWTRRLPLHRWRHDARRSNYLRRHPENLAVRRHVADENGWCNSLKRRLAIGGTDAVEQRLMRSVHDGRCIASSRQTRLRWCWFLVTVRVAYAGAAASALFVLLSSAWPVAEQAIPRLVSASAALLLATAAGLGLFSIPFIRHACTIAGLWLAVMPLFLPEPYSYMTSIGGLAIFWLAGCADDAITTRPESWN